VTVKGEYINGVFANDYQVQGEKSQNGTARNCRLFKGARALSGARG
jgi:hypothetical protein